MSPSVIVSYDGTDTDRDALRLGKLFEAAGADLALAYVRHHSEPDSEREAAAQAEAEELLQEGSRSLGGEVPWHVVMSRGTGAGLAALAEREGADIIAFGSDYRTAAGSVQPGTSAAHLLQGGPVAIAIAPAGMFDGEVRPVRVIGEISELGDLTARETAQSLADTFGAELAPRADHPVDLLVVGSQLGALPGRGAVSAAAEYVIETARSPVLVVPRGGRVRFSRASA
jgi:nucleotide-binding universal stress UspA family protein